VYRGKAYDLASFIPNHPGGEWLINLAVQRDATALFESYHLRCETAAAVFGKLPVLEDFPVESVPRAPCKCCYTIIRGGGCYKWMLSPLNGTLHTR
jgi:fatty acid desaturase (delta-4 desaturase)